MVKTARLAIKDSQRFDESLFNLSENITLSLYNWYVSWLNCLRFNTCDLSEAATRGVLCKNVFLEIAENSQENTVPEFPF